MMLPLLSLVGQKASKRSNAYARRWARVFLCLYASLARIRFRARTRERLAFASRGPRIGTSCCAAKGNAILQAKFLA